jgi:hypothetical protein
MQQFLRQAFFVSLVFLAFPLLTGAKSTSSQCDSKNLPIKDCLVRMGPYRVQFTKQKILVSDGVWREVHDLPMKGEKTEWVAVTLHKRQGRYLLQQLLWSEPEGGVGLQSLNWYLWELKGAQLHRRTHQVVQKRTSTVDKSGDKKFHADPPLSFGVRVRKGQVKSLEWFVSEKSGRF